MVNTLLANDLPQNLVDEGVCWRVEQHSSELGMLLVRCDEHLV